MITVRSGGRWKTTVRLAALWAIQTNSRERQSRSRGAFAAFTVRRERKYRASSTSTSSSGLVPFARASARRMSWLSLKPTRTDTWTMPSSA